MCMGVREREKEEEGRGGERERDRDLLSFVEQRFVAVADDNRCYRMTVCSSSVGLACQARNREAWLFIPISFY